MCYILVVDDEPSVRNVMTAWAERLGHDVSQAPDADEAVRQMAARPADVAVCDVNMPGHDGMWLAGQLRQAYPDTAVIMATGNLEADVALSSLRLGAVDYLSKPINSERFRHALARGVRWHRDAEHARQRLEMLEREVREHLVHIDAFFAATPVESDADLDRLIEGIMPHPSAVEHARRVAALATNMAVHLGIRSPELNDIQRAALLHDLGRVAMPATILCKPNRLSEEEIAIVRQQPRLVSGTLDQHPFLEPAAVMVRAAFEHVDGTGYPFALRGKEIPRGARIIAVADALDAMTHYRSYREARTPAEAMFEIRRCSGTQFDPWAVDGLLSVVHLHWASISRRTAVEPGAANASLALPPGPFDPVQSRHDSLAMCGAGVALPGDPSCGGSSGPAHSADMAY